MVELITLFSSRLRILANKGLVSLLWTKDDASSKQNLQILQNALVSCKQPLANIYLAILVVSKDAFFNVEGSAYALLGGLMSCERQWEGGSSNDDSAQSHG